MIARLALCLGKILAKGGNLVKGGIDTKIGVVEGCPKKIT